jgi:hypothetical protein
VSVTQDSIDLLLCLFIGCMSCMSFLPQELSRPEEGLRMLEFPPLQHPSSHNHPGEEEEEEGGGV